MGKRGVKKAATLVAVPSLVTAALGQATEMLPITRVVLFRSGVGYIERTGTIEGDATFTLLLREPQMNDLLKSMVLIDFDGGRILPVQYAPRDPLARTLASYAINIADNPSRAVLLSRLRGVQVEVQLNSVPSREVGSAPVHAPPIMRGSILSVETRTVRPNSPAESRAGMREEDYLSLLTEQGIQTVPLDSVASVRLLDERLQRELSSALQTLASGLDTARKPVQLQFQGKGRRRVLVGYLTEMPLWKMTYRLVLPEQGKPLLQGWAIVENTTDEDWRNVQVSLVAGRPISFVQNLYEPFYIKRPSVRPAIEEWLMPFIPEARQAIPELGAPAMMPPEAVRGRAAREAAPMLGESIEEMQRSVEQMAVGRERGALFEYRVQVPVSIARQQSAMLPVINQAVEAEAVSLYNPAQHAIHPFFAVRLTNTTNLTLMEGAVTVYYGDSYGGDALMGTLEPKGEQILTYALDLGVEVSRDQQGSRADILSVKIVRGVLLQQIRQRRTNRYTLTNRDQRARLVLIEQPFEGEWQLTEPSKAERTRNFYRFRVPVEAGKGATLQVVEERTLEERYALLESDENTLHILLRNAKASEAIQRALQEILNRRKQIANLQAAIRTQQERIQSIERDQERIRANMGQLDRASDLYKQYVQKLTQQEREIEEARRQIETLQKQLQDAQRNLTDYIQNLTI
jgi:hypothetical protein